MTLKVAVVGGGPAGLSAALEGAGRGMRVDLLERGCIGGRIACGEVIFNVFGLVPSPRVFRYKPDHIYFKGKKVYPLSVKQLEIRSVDRSLWQKSLGNRAAASGVRIMEGRRVRAGDLAGLKEDYDYIVDACGISSPTAVLYGFRNELGAEGGRALQYALEGDFSSLGRNLLVGIRPNFIGYYWIFPTGNEDGWFSANVGVGYFPASGYPKPSLEVEIRKIMAEEGFSRFRVVRKCGGVIPTRPLKRLVFDNILLAGDAAGLASPFHGGGMDTALLSGSLALQCIAQGKPGEYPKLLMEKLARKARVEQDLLELWKNIGYPGINLFFDAVLGGVNRAKFYRLFLNPQRDLWKYYKSLACFVQILLKGSRTGLPELEDLEASCREKKGSRF